MMSRIASIRVSGRGWLERISGWRPEPAACFYNRAVALAALGRRSQARRDYDAALRLDPSHTPGADIFAPGPAPESR